MPNRHPTGELRSNILRLTVAALIAGSTLAPVAMAQTAGGSSEAGKSDAEPIEEVIVSGYMQSLIDARNLKRDSDIHKDVIVAEDMAKFPELNLAESIQRLPGVTINREAGEGRRVSLRGLGPDFSRVQLNGMEVLGNVDSAQDSRGQRSRDRAFDFNIFASELFSKVEVEKSFQAAQNEGGMAGTIGLFTAKPLDNPQGMKAATSLKLGTNDYTDDTQPRIAALISQNWNDTFGALFTVAYAKRDTTEQGHNTYNYSHPSADDMQAQVDDGLDISALSAEQRAKFLSGDLYFADGNRISSWNAEMERLGITAALQWRPADNVLLTLDALHGQFTTHRDELHLATRPFNAPDSVIWDTATGASDPWPAMFRTDSAINDLRWDASNYATYTDVSNVTFGSEHRRSLNKNRFNQFVLTGEWQATDRLKLDGHVGTEKSTYRTPYDDKLYMRAKGDMTANYVSGESAAFTYGWDTTDPDNYTMDNFYFRAFSNESTLREGVVNLRYELNDELALRAGVAYHRFWQTGEEVYNDGDVNGSTEITAGTPVDAFAYIFRNEQGAWLVGDYAKAFALYHLQHTTEGPSVYDYENMFSVKESTVSAYTQLDWNTQLGGKRFRGNIGLRYYDTDTESTGWIQGDNYAYLGTANLESSYDGVLPALNAVLEFTPEVLVRFAATRNLNRPTLGSMAAQGNATISDGDIYVSRGDPALKPFKDTTLDLSLEWYFGRVGLVSAGVFHKDIENLISGVTLENVPFSETGLATSVLPGVTNDTIVREYSYPINVAEAELSGVELAAQSQFYFLPAPFDNLGVAANYTYVDADEVITGVSKNSYNGTLYYETTRWGIRGSLSHRSTWYTGHSDDPNSAGTRGFFGSTYVDAAAFVNVTPALQVTLDAINLTNEKDVQFWSQYQRLYNAVQSGTTYLAGVSYKF